LFGWGPGELGGLPYWGDALAQFSAAFATYEAKCGPISSFHDRACELFAQIKGTRIDYGEAHSLVAGHARWSRDYARRGFVSDWSEENPVILVGHSAGAQTCLQLQRLLAQDFWGLGTNANWIEAIHRRRLERLDASLSVRLRQADWKARWHAKLLDQIRVLFRQKGQYRR
jgi:triacylglycerol lipase